MNAGIGAFAGGLAETLESGLNAKSVRDWREQETAKQKLANAQTAKDQTVTSGMKNLGDAAVANTASPSAPSTVQNPGYEPGGGQATTAVPGGPGNGAPAAAPGLAPSAPDPASSWTAQLQQTLKANGFHDLAAGVSPASKATGANAPPAQAEPASTSAAAGMAPSAPVPMITQPGPSSGMKVAPTFTSLQASRGY